jgi:hypothetical protein
MALLSQLIFVLYYYNEEWNYFTFGTYSFTARSPNYDPRAASGPPYTFIRIANEINVLEK